MTYREEAMADKSCDNKVESFFSDKGKLGEIWKKLGDNGTAIVLGDIMMEQPGQPVTKETLGEHLKAAKVQISADDMNVLMDGIKLYHDCPDQTLQKIAKENNR